MQLGAQIGWHSVNEPMVDELLGPLLQLHWPGVQALHSHGSASGYFRTHAASMGGGAINIRFVCVCASER